ncbi:uncharacterized protein LOC122301739 [Carya illinoinensis]|uniref:uncharacterized protein LOC122301739 n=1 Tax=Carya illinoinensis TaxID=32201 RepID=UPI001C71AA96|nr:uncharacterized protein LOC122301739 [Carya illinoinensis]
MRLNPSKCAFRVLSGKFFGFIVSKRGIEASPDKIEAIVNMKPPKNLNETQQLLRRVATLGRFVVRSTNKCLPFFQVLWKRPEKGDVLYTFLAVSPHAVSAFLVNEEGAVQHPVYYVNRVLRGAEARYPRIELLAFALVVAARKLRPYFQAHTVRVLTEAPLAKILRKPDSTGRLIGWLIELSEFDVEYEPRKVIKGQTMANFVAEFSDLPQEEAIAPSGKPWVLYIDGSSCRIGEGLGIHLLSPDGQEWYYMATLAFKVTPKQALLSILKKKVAKNKRDWADELPEILWAYRTTTKTPTGESPFTLAFGCKAVTPVEVGLPTYRTSHFSNAQNDKKIEEYLDLLEEEREMTKVQMLQEKKKAEQYFNKRVRPRTFKVGNLVLKKSGLTTQGEEKMRPRWEGPYLVVANNRPGSYRLKDSQGKELLHPWDAEHLKKFYQ